MASGLAVALSLLTLAACGGGGGGGGGGNPSGPPPVGDCSGSSNSFDSTFDGIQKEIFEKHGCTDDLCHGSAKQGGLQLTADVSYANLLQVPSTDDPEFNRIEPGDQNRSFLWLKLAAKTDPTKLPQGVTVPGSPMPNNLPALSEDELELVRLWIFAGAPKTGTVGGTESLLNACLPPPAPITIEPLPTPQPGQGVQFQLPQWPLEAHSEHEICFAQYYDISDQVPDQFKDPSGQMFRFKGQELRQDPQSHHLILNRYIGNADPHDPAFGGWSCDGGETPGQACEPTDLTSCGSGVCISAIKQSFACVGFGPGGNGLQTFVAIGGAQKSQFDINYVPGVFAQVPTKGILYWNSHAFNLTATDTTMHARLNYYFADQQTFPVVPIFNTEKIFSGNAPPYTTQTVCNDQVLPQGARLFNLQSHTHKHGKHFTVTGPDGSAIYDSFVYNDPVSQNFDPPLKFDSPDATQRTLKYCSFYNNGVNEDGSPNPDTVTRASRVPESARLAGIGVCTPKACVAGNVGAACNGSNDNATCDSSPGAGDGVCDACRITGGESTENEMFILIGSYYIDKSGITQTNGINAALAATDVDASGRSLATEMILPPQMSCGSSPGAHAAHAAHAGHQHGD